MPEGAISGPAVTSRPLTRTVDSHPDRDSQGGWDLETLTIARADAPARTDAGPTAADAATFRMPEAAARDPASMQRLRSFVAHLAFDDHRRVVIDLSEARLLPSGFVRLLLDWQDGGAEVLLTRPRRHVRDMVWFRLFAREATEAGEATWRMTGEPAFRFTDEPTTATEAVRRRRPR